MLKLASWALEPNSRSRPMPAVDKLPQDRLRSYHVALDLHRRAAHQVHFRAGRNCGIYLGHRKGRSPGNVRLDRPRWERVERHKTESDGPTESEDASQYCHHV